MAVGANINSSGALPVIDSATRQDQVQQYDQNSQLNQYTAGQQALQGQANQLGSQLMAGQVNPAFGLPQSVWDAAFANFNKYQAPMLAAQHGAGSPAINASMQELNLQLAGLAGQKSMQNALGAYDAAAKYAYTPIGQASSNNRLANTTSNQQSWGLDMGSSLGAALDMLFPAGGTPTGFASTGSGFLAQGNT